MKINIFSIIGNKIIRYVSGCLILMLVITSCGNHNQNKESLSQSFNHSSQIINDEEPVTNAAIQVLNNKVGKIHNTETAEDAVNEFINYMATRFEETSSQEISQLGQQQSNQAILKQYINSSHMAKQELAMRTSNVSAQTKVSHFGLISAEELAKQINKYDSYANQVTEEEIGAIRDAVRRSMPNIAVDKASPLMSELEASIVTWAYGTGDDGTMAPGSITLEKPLSKVLSQSLNDHNGIKSQAIAWVAVTVITMLVVGVACGVNYTVQQMYEVDVFGNKVKDDEIIKFCWKEKRGRRTYTRWGERKETTWYYSMQDLKDAAESLEEAVYIHTNKNQNGIAVLPSSLNDNYLGIAASNQSLEFPWEEKKDSLKIGDLIFLKSTRDDVISKFSYWTHVSMLYEKVGSGRVLESVPGILGTSVYELGDNWDDTIAIAVRRILNISEDKVINAVKQSKRKWQLINYRPDKIRPELVSINGKVSYYSDWSDKYDTSAIYCSKLVWLTFKNIKNDLGEYINLDSNVTTFPDSYKRYGITLDSTKMNAPDTDDYGNTITNAYIGVSPDDIYSSKHLASDIFILGRF